MTDTFQSARLREWGDGEIEAVLPEDLPQLENTGARNRRIERCKDNIVAGAHRDLCRCLIYTENEWRAAVRAAGVTPGDGWLVRP